MKWAYVAAGAGALLMVGWMFVSVVIRAEHPVGPVHDADVKALSRRLASLEAAAERNHVQLLVLGREQERGQEAVVKNDDFDPVDDSEQLEKERAQVERTFSFYEDVFRRQATDMQFRRDMEGRLAALHQELSKHQLATTELVDYECRATMCRAEFVHEEANEQHLLPALLYVEGLSDVSIYKEVAEDGRLYSRAYLARAMPRLEEE